jgi:hypothetical protein
MPPMKFDDRRSQCSSRLRNAGGEPDHRGQLRDLPVAQGKQGIGPWTRELAIYVPTAEQMAERAKLLAGMPWLADTVRNS